MSFIRNRVVSGVAVEGVGLLGSRSLGRGGPEVWLQDSLLGSSGPFSRSDSPSELLPVVHQGIGIVSCGSRSAGKGGCRASSFFPRLLQSPVCNLQGHRGLATGDRPFASQPFCASLPFSHGDSSVGSPVFVREIGWCPWISRTPTFRFRCTRHLSTT